MGCTARERQVRAQRGIRSLNPEADRQNSFKQSSPSSKRNPPHSTIIPSNFNIGNDDYLRFSSANPNPNSSDGDWGYCTEGHLVEILLKNLDFLYSEAISKLVSLGYDEDVVLDAMLRNGHCYGNMDVLSNILNNSLAYLNSTDGVSSSNFEEPEPGFTNVRQMEECSLAGMVCLIQQIRPNFSKGDALWCLLMSDMHIGRASAMEVPVLPSTCHGCGGGASPDRGDNFSDGVIPGLCKFHGCKGFESFVSEFTPDEFPSPSTDVNSKLDANFSKRFNLTPSMFASLKRNVALFAAAGFRASSKKIQIRSEALLNSSSIRNSPSGFSEDVDFPNEHNDLYGTEKSDDEVNSMLNKFHDMNLEDKLSCAPHGDQRCSVITTLVDQIQDLEKHVKERRDWAQQKAMQAARKLSTDLTELKILRMERDETQLLKKGKKTLEETTLKRLSEMENALRKASGQVDRANAIVRRFEIENAEIKAEMEASKLSASESVTTCLEVTKREKKCLKKLLVWEKLKNKLQEEISVEKQKISDLQQQLVQIEKAKKEAEWKWREEVKAKEAGMAQIGEEQRGKEYAESEGRRKMEALRLKAEIDFQRHKDDVKRLEQELCTLKASADNTRRVKNRGGKVADECDKVRERPPEEGYRDRKCVLCFKAQVCILFLPCAHEVICSKCSEGLNTRGKVTCPCCRSPVEQKVRVFGPSS